MPSLSDKDKIEITRAFRLASEYLASPIDYLPLISEGLVDDIYHEEVGTPTYGDAISLLADVDYSVGDEVNALNNKYGFSNKVTVSITKSFIDEHNLDPDEIDKGIFVINGKKFNILNHILKDFAQMHVAVLFECEGQEAL